MRVQAITPDSNHSAVEKLKGFSIQEDAGAAASVILKKAASGGDAIWYLNLAADETASIVFGEDEYLSAEGGVYVDEVSGSVTGVLFY